MDNLLDEFKVEATGIVANVQHNLMLLEENKSNTHLVTDIFRGVHTLKGSSRMFGFENIERITHDLENVFEEIRDGERALDGGIITMGLNVMDMVNNILEGDYDEEVYKQLSAQLEKKDFEAETISLSNDMSGVFQVLYHPNKNIYDRGVKPLAAINEVKELGNAKVFVIYKGKSDEEQEKTKVYDTKFEILISLKTTYEELEDAFIFLEPEEFEIHPIEDDSEETKKELIDRLKAQLPKRKRLGVKMLEEREEFLLELSDAILKKESTTHAPPVTEENEEKVEEEGNITSNKPVDTNSMNFINVNLDRLDEMMRLVSELVTVKAELQYFSETIEHSGLSSSVDRLEKITSKFKDNAFSMRLVPLQLLSLKFQRLVRDTEQELGKKINLITDGLDTEIDKSIISEVEAPLIHIIRNAIDHGLETPEERIKLGKPEKGLLKIVAFYAGANVFIQVQDDGRGLDIEKIREKAIKKGLVSKDEVLTEKEIIKLIYKPGFTTHENATSYSGRGVGMDVVMTKLRQLRGSVEVTTEKGLGTAFTLRLPLSLSIIDVLHVKVGNINYLIPHIEIEQCFSERLNAEVIQRRGYNLKFKGKLIPHLNLMEILNEKGDYEGETSIIVINKNDQYVSLEVDEIVNEAQLVVKPVDDALKSLSYLSGVSVMGNGELAFVLDPIKLKEHFAVE